MSLLVVRCAQSQGDKATAVVFPSQSFPAMDYSTAMALRDGRFRAIPTHRTLLDIIVANQSEYGEYRALFFEGEFHTSRQLTSDARKLASVLRGRGVQKGDRVVVNLLNCPEIWLCFLACVMTGAVIVPTVPGLTVDELAFVITDSNPTVVITSREKADLLASRPTDLDSVVAIIAAGRGDPELTTILRRAAPLAQTEVTDEDDLAAIIYTSGTTGKPKGVTLSNRNLCRQACLNYCFYVGPGEDPRGATLLMPLPTCHIFGLAVALTSLLMGNLMVMMERFDPVHAIELIQTYRVKIVPAVPTMLVRILAAEAAPSACASVSQWDCGGSALSTELLEQVEQKLGGLVTEGWGLSEASSAVAQNLPGVPRKPGSVGLALPALEVLVRTLDGKPCAAGEHGELLVRGETVMRGYWNNPEATSNAFTYDNYLKTGDIGFVDEDEYCFIVGRKDDLIIRGGQNISPRELEDLIQEIPDVLDVAVVGISDEEFGQVAVAFVVPVDRNKFDERDVITLCEKRLARHKRPAQIVVVDRMPMNSSGKVLKNELRHQYKT
jgi:long-chain acyl-CoA synthetase